MNTIEQYRILFDEIEWQSPQPGARFKVFRDGARQVRLLELTPEFVEAGWCEKEHSGFVVEGELEIGFRGRAGRFPKGSGLLIPSGATHAHQARAVSPRVLLFLVEDVGATECPTTATRYLAPPLSEDQTPSTAFKSEAIRYSQTHELPLEGVLELYRALEWSSAQRPELLHKALLASHSLVTAWHGGRLVGLGNAISDGHLVVYYPHLLVHPEYQGRGIGTRLMQMVMARYTGFHQHMLAADGRAVEFYRKCGFERAGMTEPMWIYAGHDH